jgi:hypothetical protein
MRLERRKLAALPLAEFVWCVDAMFPSGRRKATAMELRCAGAV